MDKTKAKVTVFISCYNYEKFIEESIRSVLEQTYNDLELIVVDDCSTDNSWEIISSIKDSRIKAIKNNKNLGYMTTRNQYLEQFDTEYIAFQDADDVWLPTKLEKQINYLENHPNCQATFVPAVLIDENGNEYIDQQKCDVPLDFYNREIINQSDVIRFFYEQGNFLPQSGIVIRSSLISKLGLFDPTLIQLHDYDYWCRIISKYECYVFDEILLNVRRFSKKHVGLSTINEQSTNRTVNETMKVMYSFISELSFELTKESFSDIFIKEPHDDIDLKCEKYFLLLKWTYAGVNNTLPALAFYTYNYTLDFRNRLESKYNYSIKDFFNDSGKQVELYPITWNKEYQKLTNDYYTLLTKSDEKIADLTGKLDKANLEIERIINSKSWKITKPLRSITKKLRG